VAAALTMGGLLWLTATLVRALTAGMHSLAQAVLLVVLIVGGMAIYALLLALFGVLSWREAVSAIRQTTAPDLRN
jgi:putative peptidoglycan lipid II flippase